MKVFADIPYTAENDPMRMLDIYAPDNGCRATVIWMHGGGLEGGSRKGFDGIAAQLTGAGVGFVSVEYRMYPDCAFDDFVVDCADAARYLTDHAASYGLSGRIYIGGSSAGAYLTMMLCFARKYLQAVSLTPEDFAGYIFDAGQPTTHFNVLKYRGEDPRLIRVDEAAPIYYITDARPDRPLYFICADNDMPARLEQNRLMTASLKHFGYDMEKVKWTVMEGCTHCSYDYKMRNGRWVLADLIEGFVIGR